MKEPREQENNLSRKRKPRLRPRTAAWIMGMIVLLITVGASVGLFGGNRSSITLPGSVESKTETTQEEQQFTLTDADISVSNVQQVIASLKRPDAYSMAIDNTVFWDQDWSTCQVNRYVRSGVSLTEYLNTTQEAERYEMIDGDMYYAWRVGKKKYHKGSSGSLSADQASMIPTYETILDADLTTITDAGLRTIDGVPCVYAVLKDEDSGYTITYSVSTVTGLLLQAEYTRGDELVRSVSVSALDMTIPEESLFALPDGTNLVTEAEKKIEAENDAQTESNTETESDNTETESSSEIESNTETEDTMGNE